MDINHIKVDHRGRCFVGLAVFGMALGLLSAPSSAQEYPYYVPYPVYRPLDVWPPTGAALGPWHWNFDLGGAPTPVIGESRDHLTGGGTFTIGGGYNFTPRTGFVLEFMNSWLGVTDGELQRNQATSGDASVVAITLNPIWRYRIAGPLGGYIIGGGGFYEREERFSEPVQVFIPTFSGGFYVPGVENVHQIDDTGGVNIGAGLTCNLGWGTKFFVEVRYHYLFTSGYSTQLLPVTLGFRW
jgi:hypothetical protein